MGLWIPIILMCGGPFIESCKVITGQELIHTKEQCFRVSREKANKAVETFNSFWIKRVFRQKTNGN